MNKLISILAILVGCSATHVDIPENQYALDDLDLALEAWARSEPDSYRYTMVYRDSARCYAYEYEVQVRNGLTESSNSRRILGSCDESIADIQDKDGKPHLAEGATVTSLLTYIAQMDCPLYASHSRGVHCPRDGAFFEARYHPQMGFPISFRYIYGELLDEQFGNVLDDQQSRYDFEYRVTEFQIVE